ncbi:MAG: helix-turn-helix domain-containing protein [Firmicutes bacterium]|nr:helix-turn-helix domain-containing protein [Bacillota bacterium]
MEFPQILTTLRKEQKLTKDQLAQKIGFSNVIISYWEYGKREPSSKALKALAKYFKVSADYLLGLEDEYGNEL